MLKRFKKSLEEGKQKWSLIKDLTTKKIKSLMELQKLSELLGECDAMM